MKTKPTNIIAVGNNKGGVAKTQTVFELAFFFAKHGKKVLVVDTDPQANTSTVLLSDNTPPKRFLADIILDGDGIRKGDIAHRHFPGCRFDIDYICTNLNMSRIESRLNPITPRELLLKDALSPIALEYDTIIIDMPPQAELTTLFGLYAANYLLIPSAAERFSLDGVETMCRYANTLKKHPNGNPNLAILGIIVNRFRGTIVNKAILDKLATNFGDHLILPVIPECARVQQALEHDLPVLAFDAKCKAGVSYKDVFSVIYKIVMDNDFA